MRALAGAALLVMLGFIYIPLGWALLRVSYRIIGAFWGLW